MVRLLLVLLLPASLPRVASGLRCAVCNSLTDGSCRDAPQKHYRECPPPPMDAAAGANDTATKTELTTLCRKTTISFTNPQIELRLYRSCGYKRDTKDCRKLLPMGGAARVCQCFTDYCNRGAPSGGSLAALLPGLLVFHAIQ